MAQPAGLDGLATKIFGFTSTDEVALLLLIFAALMLILMVATLVHNAAREGRVPMIRVEATGETPELSLHEGHRFHLFNSHIWSTGQDAVATIKRQLQRLVPGVRVFLE